MTSPIQKIPFFYFNKSSWDCLNIKRYDIHMSTYLIYPPTPAPTENSVHARTYYKNNMRSPCASSFVAQPGNNGRFGLFRSNINSSKRKKQIYIFFWHLNSFVTSSYGPRKHNFLWGGDGIFFQGLFLFGGLSNCREKRFGPAVTEI